MKNGLQKFERNIIKTLHDFSYAEFGSAIEMLHAMKVSKTLDLQKQFLRHTLEEYAHYRMMNSLVKKYLSSENFIDEPLRFLPELVVQRNIVNPRIFLSEKYGTDKFIVFISVNEKNASKIFKKLETKCDVIDKKFKGNQSAIIENVGKCLSVIQQEEEHHHDYSLENAEKSINFFKLRYYKTVVYLQLKLRELHLKNKLLNYFIYKTITYLIIFLIYPMRSILQAKKRKQKNIWSLDEARIML